MVNSDQPKNSVRDAMCQYFKFLLWKVYLCVFNKLIWLYIHFLMTLHQGFCTNLGRKNQSKKFEDRLFLKKLTQNAVQGKLDTKLF